MKRLECASISLLPSLLDPFALSVVLGVIECEQPHPDLYKFAGRFCVKMEGARYWTMGNPLEMCYKLMRIYSNLAIWKAC